MHCEPPANSEGPIGPQTKNVPQPFKIFISTRLGKAVLDIKKISVLLGLNLNHTHDRFLY